MVSVFCWCILEICVVIVGGMVSLFDLCMIICLCRVLLMRVGLLRRRLSVICSVW